MEVLQTSALPLGDGAGRNRMLEGYSGRVYRRRQQRVIRRVSGASICTKPKLVISVSVPKRERTKRSPRRSADVAACAGAATGRDVSILERETGFEPATSTLARSHSTTELFPPTRTARRRHTPGPAAVWKPQEYHSASRPGKVTGSYPATPLLGREATSTPWRDAAEPFTRPQMPRDRP
jgi:hypothetical protein